MSTESATKRAATIALYGSGGVGALSAGLFGVIAAEGLLARWSIGMTADRPPTGDGLYGEDLAGPPVSFLLLGDSAAVGYGMTDVDDTPAAMVGWGLSHLLDRPVQVTSHAVVGARTSDLDAQIDLGLEAKPDVALIVVGTNDVTHRVLTTESARRLAEAVRRLREADCEVVVGTCPDLGTVQPLPQPLRLLARVWSRRLAAKQAVATLQAGGRVVSLAGLLGEVFAAKADIMFGIDGFHPSRTGYANMISVVIPALAAAVRAEDLAAAYADQPRDMMTVSDAAIEAAQHGGTELVRTGRWAAIRRRKSTH